MTLNFIGTWTRSLIGFCHTCAISPSRSTIDRKKQGSVRQFHTTVLIRRDVDAAPRGFCDPITFSTTHKCPRD
jgi:hypothetical protein